MAFTKGLARQLVQKGIRVNGVAPGPVWTPLQVASLPVYELWSETQTPMERAAQPYETAPSYVFLALIKALPTSLPSSSSPMVISQSFFFKYY